MSAAEAKSWFPAECRHRKEIAKALDISADTVDRHHQNLMVKLDLHSQAELIHHAFRKGLLEKDL